MSIKVCPDFDKKSKRIPTILNPTYALKGEE
jgi:hypothetical protein